MGRATLHDPIDPLLAEIRGCRACAKELAHTPRPVLRASSTARLCVVGQAPGTKVHETGIPFNDRSGVVLRDWLGLPPEIFYDERRVAIIPMGFCFPGQDEKGADKPPRKECASLWRDKLFAGLPQIELTLLVGQYAQRWHLGAHNCGSVSETVARWRDFLPDYFPLPHPSWRNQGWLKTHPWFTEDVVPELRRRVAAILSSS